MEQESPSQYLSSSSPQHTEEGRTANKPDYVVKQYRQIKTADGWITRSDSIGSAWKASNDAICIRPAGVQVLTQDVYLFALDRD